MSRRVSGRHLAPLLALVLATFLVVGACGDDGDDASPTPGDGTAQPTVTAAPVTFPASIDACDLVRIDELVRFLGGDPITDSGGEDDTVAFCTWPGTYEGNISSVSLAITTSPSGFDVQRNQPGYEPLEDVGDEAYIQTVGASSGDLLDNLNSIIVKDGIYYVSFSVSGPLEGNEVRDEMLTVLQRILRDLP